MEAEALAIARAKLKKKDKAISNRSSIRVSYEGILSEILFGDALGLEYNVKPHRGGDGHRKDLWSGDVTIGAKFRNYEPAGYILMPHQGKDFNDDIGICALTVEHDIDNGMDILGFFTKDDWVKKKTDIWLRPNKKLSQQTGREDDGRRIGIKPADLRDIRYLHEEIQTIQESRLIRGLRDWARSGGCQV